MSFLFSAESGKIKRKLHNVFTAVVLLAFLTVGAVAIKNKIHNIAVLDFGSQGVSASDSIFVAEFFREGIVKSKRFNVVDRNNLDKVLAEQGFQQTACTEVECAVKIGKILNIRYIVTGKFGKLLNKFVVSVNMVDVETGKILYSNHATTSSESRIHYLTDKLVSSLVRTTFEGGETVVIEDTYNSKSDGNSLMSGSDKETVYNLKYGSKEEKLKTLDFILNNNKTNYLDMAANAYKTSSDEEVIQKIIKVVAFLGGEKYAGYLNQYANNYKSPEIEQTLLEVFDIIKSRKCLPGLYHLLKSKNFDVALKAFEIVDKIDKNNLEFSERTRHITVLLDVLGNLQVVPYDAVIIRKKIVAILNDLTVMKTMEYLMYLCDSKISKYADDYLEKRIKFLLNLKYDKSDSNTVSVMNIPFKRGYKNSQKIVLDFISSKKLLLLPELFAFLEYPNLQKNIGRKIQAMVLKLTKEHYEQIDYAFLEEKSKLYEKDLFDKKRAYRLRFYLYYIKKFKITQGIPFLEKVHSNPNISPKLKSDIERILKKLKRKK
ncbi:MAG: CsgG/HfaB family protein [bacterium]